MSFEDRTNALSALQEQCDAIAAQVERQIQDFQQTLSRIDELKHSIQIIIDRNIPEPAAAAPETLFEEQFLPDEPPSNIPAAPSAVAETEVSLDDFAADLEAADFEVTFGEEMPALQESEPAAVVAPEPPAPAPQPAPLPPFQPQHQESFFAGDPFLDTMMISRDDLPLGLAPAAGKTVTPEAHPDEAESFFEPPAPPARFVESEVPDFDALGPLSETAMAQAPAADEQTIRLDDGGYDLELMAADPTLQTTPSAPYIEDPSGIPILPSDEQILKPAPEPKKGASKSSLITGDDVANSLDEFFGMAGS
jgi:hypothetical protein